MSICPYCKSPYTPGDVVCRSCGNVFPSFSADIIPMGTILQGRYKIEELTHSGGMGYVYAAKDLKLHERFCIVKQVKEPVKTKADLEKLEGEAIEMAKLSHPNVAVIFDHFVDGQFYFLVVEFIHGKTLREIYEERQGQLTENEVIEWAISMCGVASYLHKEGIIHRDISPQNIMLSDDGIIKFIDFGTLKELRHIATGGTAGMGKYGYTPPEQWFGTPDIRSDIFAIGATIYNLLTGFLPLSNEYLSGGVPQSDEFNPSFPPIREKNLNTSLELESILQKALKLDVNLRYSSANEFRDALKALIKVMGPVLNISSNKLDFPNAVVGKRIYQSFTIMNIGIGRLSGRIAASKPWLNVSPVALDIEAGEQKIDVMVDTTGLAPGLSEIGTINIFTNSGEATIDVALSTMSLSRHSFGIGLMWAGRLKWLILLAIIIAATAIIFPKTILKSPELSIDARQIAFNNLRPDDISNSQELTIKNTGGSILTGTASCTKSWLAVSPVEIKIPYGEEILTAHVNTNGLPYGFTDIGFINIETNGGSVQIAVNLTIAKVIFEDDFDNSSSGWTVSSGSIGVATYENNGYHLVTQKTNQLIAGTNPAIGQLTDFTLDVDAQSLTLSPDTSYGIIFRQSDINLHDNFYYFSISSSNSQYRLIKQLNGIPIALQDWTDSKNINHAPSINHLTLICKGKQIELRANNSTLAIITDSSFIGGFIWLVAESGPEVDSRADMIFDNMVISFPD